jgi:hypothetical protein
MQYDTLSIQFQLIAAKFVDIIRLPKKNDAYMHNSYIGWAVTACGYGKVETGKYIFSV